MNSLIPSITENENEQAICFSTFRIIFFLKKTQIFNGIKIRSNQQRQGNSLEEMKFQLKSQIQENILYWFDWSDQESPAHTQKQSLFPVTELFSHARRCVSCTQSWRYFLNRILKRLVKTACIFLWDSFDKNYQLLKPSKVSNLKRLCLIFLWAAGEWGEASQ